MFCGQSRYRQFKSFFNFKSVTGIREKYVFKATISGNTFEARNGDTSIMRPDAVKHSQHFARLLPRIYRIYVDKRYTPKEDTHTK